jgi:hypothetical protein
MQVQCPSSLRRLLGASSATLTGQDEPPIYPDQIASRIRIDVSQPGTHSFTTLLEVQQSDWLVCRDLLLIACPERLGGGTVHDLGKRVQQSVGFGITVPTQLNLAVLPAAVK